MPTPTTAFLTGDPYGTTGIQQAFTVTLDQPAGLGGVVVTPASNVPGDTFQAAVGGVSTANITIRQGDSAGTFWLTPVANGARNVTITSIPSLTYTGSPVAVTVGTTWQRWSVVQGFAAGLSGVTYKVITSAGTTYTAATSSGVVALGNGSYGALVSLPTTGGFAIQWGDGGSPAKYATEGVNATAESSVVVANILPVIQSGFAAVESSIPTTSQIATAYLAQAIGTPRALDSVADSSMTVADAHWAAILAGVGRKDASSGTMEIISTPGSGTVLRTLGITTSSTSPFGVNFPVKVQ